MTLKPPGSSLPINTFTLSHSQRFPQDSDRFQDYIIIYRCSNVISFQFYFFVLMLLCCTVTLYLCVFLHTVIWGP